MTPVQPHIADIAPYALAKPHAPSGWPLVSLSQNESLRPPSPKALEAARLALAEAALYPDPDWSALRQALGVLHGIDPTNILCGNGSLDLIDTLARVFAGPGKAALAPRHAYPFFRAAALLSGARFDTAAEHDLTVNVDALLAAVTQETSVVFVANPGNPTGTCIPKEELVRLRSGLDDGILLVIDEAYGEFVDLQVGRCWDMVNTGNTVVLRTFSKAYGLAALRIGWGLFPEHVAVHMRKALNPNAVTSMSQAAAIGALHDQDYMLETCRITGDYGRRLTEDLTQLGFDVLPGCTNFLNLKLRNANRAVELDAFLNRRGVFARRQQAAGLPDLLRVTIGDSEKNASALAAMRQWITERP